MAGSNDDARTDDELYDEGNHPVEDYSMWTKHTVANAREVDRLRAELDRHRALRDEGDLLVAVVESYNVNDDVRWSDVEDAIGAWRAVRSVRGDAPAAGQTRGRVPDFGTCTPAETRFVNAVASAAGDAANGHALFSRRYRVAGAALEALRAEPGADRDRLASTIELGFRGATRDTTWRELAERAADALVETGQAPAAAPTDGQAPADEPAGGRELAAMHEELRAREGWREITVTTTNPDGTTDTVAGRGNVTGPDFHWGVLLVKFGSWGRRIVEAPAAPADDTAAPSARQLTADDVTSAIREWNITSTDLPRDAFLAERLNVAAARPSRGGGPDA